MRTKIKNLYCVYLKKMHDRHDEWYVQPTCEESLWKVNNWQWLLLLGSTSSQYISSEISSSWYEAHCLWIMLTISDTLLVGSTQNTLFTKVPRFLKGNIMNTILNKVGPDQITSTFMANQLLNFHGSTPLTSYKNNLIWLILY